MRKINPTIMAAAILTTAALSALCVTASHRRASGDAVLSDKADLHAIIVGNPEWPLTDPHRGVYSIGSDLSLAQEVEANTTMTFGATHPGFVADGKYYLNKSSVMLFPFSSVQGTSIEVYDLTTGELDATHQLPPQFSNVALSFAYDRVNDIVYAVTYGATSSVTLLTTFDPVTCEFGTDGKPLGARFSAMACDAEGHLYGIRQNSAQLCGIDVADGTVSDPIATWSETPGSAYPQSMTYDAASGCLLWAFTTNAQETRLISINPDPENTRMRALGDGLGKNVVHALYSTAPLADDEAPAAVADLAYTFSQPGSLEGTLTFTAPSLTVGGTPLSGQLTATYYIDGKEAGTFSAQAGEKTEHAVACPSEGTHKLGLRLTKGVLVGPRSFVSVFAGFDTPTAVRNLKHILSDNRILVTWDAPEGVNGGTLDKISYTVTHNDDESIVTESTSYVYEVKGDVSVHNFTVVAAAGGKTGEAAALDGIVAGDPINLPYACGFDTPDQWALYTVINANNDNTLWKWFEYGTKYAQCNKTYGDGPADDWLLTPPLALEDGNVYSLSFDAETNGPRPEALAVFLTDGTALSDVEKGRELYSNTDLAINGIARQQILFSAARSGAANLAFHYFTEDGIRVNIDNILVECFGKTTAPKCADGLRVIPGPEGALSAEFTFNAPTEQFDGAALASIDRIEIRRNGQLLTTIDAPRPGAFISYQDKSVPGQGTYEYSVTVYNASGAGQTVAVSEYIGALTLPIVCPDEQEFSLFTFDNTGDTGWQLDAETGDLIYANTEAGAHNDIANSPFFYLRKGEVVSISFDYSALGGEEDAQQIGMWIGLNSIRNPYIQNISPLCWIRPGDSDVMAEPYTMLIPEDGVYAFHFSTYYPSAKNVGIRISNLRIETAGDPGAPNKVSGIGITAADNGVLEGVITFVMPRLSLDNNPLEGSVDAIIYGPDRQQVGEVTGAQPGEQVSADIIMTQGVQSYYVTTSNILGIGATASWTAFAGIDRPQRVTEPYSAPTSDNLSTDISWSEPDQGMYKGWYDRSQLRYKIYLDGEYITTVERPEYFFTATETTQKVYTFGVVPVTDAGEGVMSDPIVNILGTPLQAPFTETFSGGTFDNNPWNITYPYFEDCKWEVRSDFKGEPAIVLQSYIMTDSYAQFPKITLAGMQQAVLEFEHYRYHGRPPLFEAGQFIRVLCSDDEINYITLLQDGGESGSDEAEGWYKVNVSLDRYLNRPWIALKLYGMVHEDYDFAAVRDIRIYDPATGNVAASFADGAGVYGGKGQIRIEGFETPAEIFTAGGLHVASTSESVIDVEPGIYVVAVGSRRYKVIVR